MSARRLGRNKVTANLLRPNSAAEWREARRLVEEYASSLNLDLSFQNFAQELDHFETEYSRPAGAFLLAREKGSFVGCVGLRKVSDTVGEIKRLYVAPSARGLGLGQALVRGIVDEGKQLGYARLVLDTLPSMLEARSLYHELGFKPVAPYRYNPVSGTAFLELQLRDQEGA
jgi:putative acetyltransferase